MPSGKLLAAMSGGVDSAAAARLLLDEGYDVLGAFMVLHDSAAAEAEQAVRTAAALGIPLEVLDLRQTFSQQVQARFQADWAAGKTPNPCVTCNKAIKFGALLDAAAELGCGRLATGHYARTEAENGRTLLRMGVDENKDQSYFLARLDQRQLSAAYFPLGGLTKAQVRELAGNLPAAQNRESQDVCFLPEGDYAAWLAERGFHFTPGNFILSDGTVLGPHNGAERLTIGQRRGLGIAMGQRVYVTARRGDDLVVGPEEDLMHRRVRLTDLNLIPVAALKESVRVAARLRYRHRAAPAWLHPLEDGGAVVEFDTPQRAPAPGQTAVCYVDDYVFCAGEIT